MKAIIIIALIILILYWIIKKGNENSLSENDDMAKVFNEVSELFEEINNFANQWNDYCGLIMIIPINNMGNMYANDCNRLRVSLLWYDDKKEFLEQILSYNNPIPHFVLSENDGSIDLISRTKNVYNSKYKVIMKHINKKLCENYPEINFEFEGSRIMKK